jgi:hypothetical protein
MGSATKKIKPGIKQREKLRRKSDEKNVKKITKRLRI